MTDRKRAQVVEMWNCGKTVGKISRELRLEPLQVAEVVSDLYSAKESRCEDEETLALAMVTSRKKHIPL